MAKGADDTLILFANEAFYAAFAAGDIEAMDGIWAREFPCVCLHPGATPIYDRAEIMRSWAHILADPGVREMQMHNARIVAYDDFALVICYETLGGGTLVASNGFVREKGQWRMISHHAGPCPDAPDEEQDTDDDENSPAPRLH